MSAKYSKMTVAELKKELNKRGLEESGLKAALVKRLVDDDEGGAEEAEAEEVEAEPEVESTGKRKSTRAASKTPAKAKAKKKAKSNKGKEEEEEEEEDDEEEDAIAAESKPESHTKKAAEALRAAAEAEKKKGKAKGVPKPDELAPRGTTVFEDYDCMLNQTNIGQNNNKFYRIQVLQQGASYSLWTHWGRVGERGQFSNKPMGTNSATAVSAFEKQFKSKTSNDWNKRDKFTPKSGKYTLIEMSYEDDEPSAGDLVALPAEPSKPKKIRKCTLDPKVKELVDLIFDHDMFKEALTAMKIDTNKMPLGKISKTQIAKGYEILEEMMQVVNGGRGSTLSELSSRFYTAIPHSFGRMVPPVINTQEKIKEKIDLLNVLGDIEIAQSLQKGKDAKEANIEEIDHPADANYKLLDSDLEPLDPKQDKEEWDFIQKYADNTSAGWRKGKLLDVYRVNRRTEGPRFKSHDKLKNRKLLWHGTKMPVIVAILKGGLRIMPHSGGRVGAGLYFASEHSKSAGYVGTTQKNIGVMFLNEVALGEEKHITKDDCTLKAAPPGYDCVIAQGRTEPDPKEDIVFKFEGKDVVVPQGKPIQRAQYNNSNFSQTEYLVYKESQVRVRYLLKFQF
eukprot:TRINITY_DN282_c0_g1_i1.p1 TRINITY_DN282_c0_g1~~TRINITY_DN282_c0_g1_i1.p1  ORF type:complete len:620 (-),score=233.35 TRINITY_DN282_c0_g1_i1:121-1980(-)